MTVWSYLWGKRHPEKIREYNRKYRHSHPEVMKKLKDTRTDRQYFGGLRNEVYERDGYKCIMCGMSMDDHIKKYHVRLSIDHKDGNGRYSQIKNNVLDNLQTLCLHCHGKKDGHSKKGKT